MTPCILACLAATAMARTGGGETTIPTEYAAGHFYAAASAMNGQRVRLLVDSGGAGFQGLYAVKRDVASRLGAAMTTCRVDDHALDVMGPVSFRAGAGIPHVTGKRPCDADALVINGDGSPDDADGMLGAGYLSRFIWSFDYPGRRLSVELGGWRPGAHADRIPLSFAHSATGRRVSDFPALTVKIGGDPVHLLLDTGATAFPTEAGLKASRMMTVKGEGVASYITKSVFDGWHARHPDWRVVERGDRLLPDTRLIEVPEVDLGGRRVGPVWFTERPDRNFGPEEMSG